MRVLNKKYWPYRVQTNFRYGEDNDVFHWCEKNLPGKHRWTFAGPNVWYFKKERDVTMFTLRWSSN